MTVSIVIVAALAAAVSALAFVMLVAVSAAVRQSGVDSLAQAG